MALYLLHGKNPWKIARYLDLMSNFANERIHIKCLESVRMILKYVKAGDIFPSKIWVPFLQNFSRKYLHQVIKFPWLQLCRCLLAPANSLYPSLAMEDSVPDHSFLIIQLVLYYYSFIFTQYKPALILQTTTRLADWCGMIDGRQHSTSKVI